jgi:large subunit ribosomal protein L18
MKTKNYKTYTVAYRRKLEGKTDYKKRLNLILSGKNRLVVRKSLSTITAQIIEYSDKGDKVTVSASTTELKKLGWNYNCKNVPSAYLLGALVAKKAQEKNVTDAILDIGLNKSIPGSRLYAVLKGAVDNGLNVPHSEDILPNENRINGKHIEDYANLLKKDEKEFDAKFSEYKKNNADPTKITKIFAEVKNKIIGA